MKKYKLLVALMLLIALIGKSVISLGVTQADVDAEKKKADQLKTEAEQKKKELTNIKSDKAVATTDLNTINSQIDSLQSEIDALGENLDELNSEIKTKENEIKEKELEAKRDYYRPVFVIETDQHNNKSVKLLMKDKYLYLEKINYLTLESDSVKYKGECKHGEIIIPQITNTFFMTAETLIGEIIFFGYIDGKKIYKYLKTNQIPFPTQQEVYKKDEYDKIWNSFNTFNTEGDLYLESLLFEYTFFLRLYLYYDINRFLPNSLQTKTLKDFFDNIFKDLSVYLINNNNNTIHKSNNIYKILDLFTKELGKHKHSLRIDLKNRQPFKNHIYTAKLLTDDYSEIINDKNNTLDNSYIINIII